MLRFENLYIELTYEIAIKIDELNYVHGLDNINHSQIKKFLEEREV